MELFLQRTQPQSEQDFIKLCFPNPTSHQCNLALAIRRAIASLGRVELELIRADASFEDLMLLPFWESCGDSNFQLFDFLDFIEAIESELNMRLPDENPELATYRDPDHCPEMKVYEFIQEFYNCYLWFIN